MPIFNNNSAQVLNKNQSKHPRSTKGSYPPSIDSIKELRNATDVLDRETLRLKTKFD
jgi:hypothetical protein